MSSVTDHHNFLAYLSRLGCGVEVKDSLIVSGGYDTPEPVWTYDLDSSWTGSFYAYSLSKKKEAHIPVSTVVIFKKNGAVEFLPSLIEPRAQHACASYLNEYGQTVSYISQYSALVGLLFLLITGHPRHRRCEGVFCGNTRLHRADGGLHVLEACCQTPRR